MTVSSNNNTETLGLRKNALSIRDVVFQGVAASAPAGAAVATMTGAAAFALGVTGYYTIYVECRIPKKGFHNILPFLIFQIFKPE